MRFGDLTYKELCDLTLDITNEFSERFCKDPKDPANEFIAIRDMELAAGALRTSLEQSGKIKGE